MALQRVDVFPLLVHFEPASGNRLPPTAEEVAHLIGATAAVFDTIEDVDFAVGVPQQAKTGEGPWHGVDPWDRYAIELIVREVRTATREVLFDTVVLSQGTVAEREGVGPAALANFMACLSGLKAVGFDVRRSLDDERALGRRGLKIPGLEAAVRSLALVARRVARVEFRYADATVVLTEPDFRDLPPLPEEDDAPEPRKQGFGR